MKLPGCVPVCGPVVVLYVCISVLLCEREGGYLLSLKRKRVCFDPALSTESSKCHSPRNVIHKIIHSIIHTALPSLSCYNRPLTLSSCLSLTVSVHFLPLSYGYIDIYLSVSIFTSQLLTVHSLTLISVFIFFVVFCLVFFFSFPLCFSPSVLRAE